VIGTRLSQGTFAAGDLRVELIDQMHRGGGVTGPQVGQRQPVKQLPAADAEQVRHRARVAEGQQGGVDAVLLAVRWRTRCSRQRARSRSARTAGVGSQIAGTRSRRDSSASTQASILSVLQANGASP
jgi:hypothetical protein